MTVTAKPNSHSSQKRYQAGRAEYAWLTLPESVDNHLSPNELLTSSNGNLLLIDAALVARITSSGVLQLTRLLQLAHSYGLPPVLIAVPPALITQLNLTPALAQSVSVFSVLAPYYCPECDTEQRHELMMTPESVQPTTPDLPCTQCNMKAVFDDVSTVLFRFTGHTLPLALERIAQAIQLREAASQGASSASNHTALQSTSHCSIESNDETRLLAGNASAATTPERLADSHMQRHSDQAQWRDTAYYLIAGSVLAGIVLVVIQWISS